MNKKSDKRRQIIALISTVGVHVLLLIFFLQFRLIHSEPTKTFEGIAINFGQEDGVRMPSQQKVVPQETQAPKVSGDESDVLEGNPVITQEIEETIKIAEKDSQAQQKKVEEEEKKVDKDLEDALKLFSEASEKEVKQNDMTDVSKGSPDANPEEATAHGETGQGKAKSGFFLGDRSAIHKGIPPFNCEESGIVVVRVWVDPAGRTIKAQPGIKGSTDTSPCLMKEAKEAALSTKWSPDPLTKSNQIGEIRYNFGFK